MAKIMMPVAIAAAGVFGIAGCATSAPATSAASSDAPTAATPAATSSAPAIINPVTILRKIKGCRIDPIVKTGETDFDGNRYASCDFYDNDGTAGTDVTVRAYPGNPRTIADPANLTGDDSHKVILGPSWIATVTGDWTVDGYSGDVDPKVVAKEIGGTFVDPAATDPATAPAPRTVQPGSTREPAGTSITAAGVQTVLPNIKDFTSDVLPRYRTLDALMAAGGDTKAELAKEGLTYTDSSGGDDPQAKVRTIKRDGQTIGLMEIFWNPRVVEVGLGLLQAKELNSQPLYALVNWNEGWAYVFPDDPTVRKGLLQQQKKMGGVVYHLVPN